MECASDIGRSFFDGLIKLLSFMRVGDIMELVIEDMKNKGVIWWLMIILTYRIILEAVIWKRIVKPRFDRH